MTKAKRAEWFASLGPDDARAVAYAWECWARPEQLAPPGDWTTWLINAGRGFGKTRAGAEWIRSKAASDKRARLGIVARTAADARDTMIEGESGILAISPPWFFPHYEPSKRRLTWPNGARATVYSADEPNLLRGPQHHYVWADEIAAWKYPDAWDQIQFGLRLGENPQAVATTTPRPVRVVRELLADADCVVSHGSTYDNAANLPEKFLKALEKKYKGTTLGRQELYAELLEEMPGALWSRSMIDRYRVDKDPEKLDRLTINIDPAVSSGEGSAEHGITVTGSLGDHGYLLDDLSLRGKPDAWAKKVIWAFKNWNADRIIAESNQGGEMVRHTIHTYDPNVPVTLVHASRGKETRAEPVAAMYEQGRIHHVGTFTDLEDQLCNWIPGEGMDSPDRLDSLVWGFTWLLVRSAAPTIANISGGERSNIYRGL